MLHNQLLFSQTPSVQTTPYTFTTGELESLRGKLQMAEQQILSSHSKNGQVIIQFSLSEIRTVQKMVDMTYLQGLSNSGVVQSRQVDTSSAMSIKSPSGNMNVPPSNYVCHKCGIQGHYVQDCPNVIGKGFPPKNYVCHKCNIQGHWIQECPLGNQQDYSKSPPPGYCCHRCGVSGHWIKNCPTNNNVDNTTNATNSNTFSRDKISQTSNNTQQVQTVFTQNEGYLEKESKIMDGKNLNARMTVTQGQTYVKKRVE